MMCSLKGASGFPCHHNYRQSVTNKIENIGAQMEHRNFDARMHTTVDMPHANHAPDFSQEIMHNGARGSGTAQQHAGAENGQIIRGDEQHGRSGGPGRTGPVELPSPGPDGRRPPIEMPSPGPDGRRPPIEMPSPRPKSEEPPATKFGSQIRELDFSANCPFGERHR